MATSGGGFFASLFGSSGGGIAHNAGNTNVQVLPRTNPQDNNNNPSGGNPANAPAPAPAPAPDPINSQLDQLVGVWHTPTTADGKPVGPQPDPLAQQMFQFDPAKVQEGASKLDFTTGISPEKAAAALGGDIDAFKEVINQAVRTAFVGSTLNTGNLLNDGFARHGRNIDQALPGRIRNFQVSSSKSEDPILSHAAFAPMVSAMRGVIASKMPNASADEVTRATEEYFLQIGNVFATRKQKEEAKASGAAEEEVDWLKSMGLG